MTAKKHSLAPLQGLRADAAEAASRALGHARRLDEEAIDTTRRSAEALEATLRASEAVRRGEAAALSGGRLRVADLMLEARWEIGADARRLAAEEDDLVARKERFLRTEEVEARRVQTALAQADAEAVARLRSRASKARLAKEEAAAEEAAEDASSARALGRKIRADE